MSLVPQKLQLVIPQVGSLANYDDEEEFDLTIINPPNVQSEISQLRAQLGSAVETINQLSSRIQQLEAYCSGLTPVIAPVVQQVAQEMSREEAFLRKFLETYYLPNPQGQVPSADFNKLLKTLGLNQKPPINFTPQKLYPLMEKLGYRTVPGHARERKYIGLAPRPQH